jgi:hypothetical protein
MFVRLVASHFVAGVEVGVRAAPIVSYLRTWTLPEIEAYALTHGWQVEVLDHGNDPSNRRPAVDSL